MDTSPVFYTLTQSLNYIWGKKHRQPFWKQRDLAIAFVLALIGPILVLASFTGSIVSNLRAWLPNLVSPLESGIGLLVAILLDIGLFMMVYMMLPHGASGWREILPGAIGGGLLWELAKKAFLSFVTGYLSAQNLIYGSVATIIAFLTWAYFNGLIFLFGVYISLYYFKLKQRRQEPQSQ